MLIYINEMWWHKQENNIILLLQDYIFTSYMSYKVSQVK
jgi:hypothetical protein